jgi:glucose-6-phosphate isomerase
MTMQPTQQTGEQLWQRFKAHYATFPKLGLSVDISRMNFADDFFDKLNARTLRAFRAMARLEKGAIANPDENRMVGHYWLRNTAITKDRAIAASITKAIADIKDFAAKVHTGAIQGERGPFKNLLVVGIGGSALGPQFVASALGNPAADKLKPFFFDNTDPDGMDKVIAALGSDLGQTLVVVISKSGETKETRNGMLEAKKAYEKAGLNFAKHTVAVTGEGKSMDQLAIKEGWIQRFPMWDWVGGRTSVTSAVGLLPAALQGISIDDLLAGAKACDEQTRIYNVKENPSILLSLMWYHSGNGKGLKDMVILPYKDRLELFSKYLQQLIMESLGKELDLKGKVVHQGIAVYGNKGSTDQHAYVQQLRDGVPNFFATFIEVLKDRTAASMEVESGVTSGDFLAGFLHGTRKALYENNRQSITLTINEVSPFAVGVLIALYERAVGFYATMVNINAYHQPGVQAGKVAAGKLIELQHKIVALLKSAPGQEFKLEQIASGIGQADSIESVFNICEHLVANPGRGVRKTAGANPFDAGYAAA